MGDTATVLEEEDADERKEADSALNSQRENAGAVLDGNEEESDEELIREPTDYSPKRDTAESAEMVPEMESDEVSLPSGMDDDGDVLNGDDHEEDFNLDELDVDL